MKTTKKSKAFAIGGLLLAIYVGLSGPLAGLAYRNTNAVNGSYWLDRHERYYWPLEWGCAHTGSYQALLKYYEFCGWNSMVDTG